MYDNAKNYVNSAIDCIVTASIRQDFDCALAQSKSKQQVKWANLSGIITQTLDWRWFHAFLEWREPKPLDTTSRINKTLMASTSCGHRDRQSYFY